MNFAIFERKSIIEGKNCNNKKPCIHSNDWKSIENCIFLTVLCISYLLNLIKKFSLLKIPLIVTPLFIYSILHYTMSRTINSFQIKRFNKQGFPYKKIYHM